MQKQNGGYELKKVFTEKYFAVTYKKSIGETVLSAWKKFNV